MGIGAVSHLLASCSSTNDVAKEMAAQGAREGTVVWADEQTEGRGTKGRAWHSPPRLGLYLSIILRPPADRVSLLPLVAGIAAAEAIRASQGIDVQLKWPNDIVWSGKKLGGILCESEFIGSLLSCAILGLGLNVNHRPKDFPAELRPVAVSLRMIQKRAVASERVAESLFQALDVWYDRLLADDRGLIVRTFESKLIFPIGKVITVKAEKGASTGIFLGFDAEARLIMETGGSQVVFSPAEILEIGYNT